MKSSSFDEMWLGKEKRSTKYVTIRKVKDMKKIEENIDTCRKCSSGFLTRCIDERSKKDETWVGLLSVN